MAGEGSADLCSDKFSLRERRSALKGDIKMKIRSLYFSITKTIAAAGSIAALLCLSTAVSLAQGGSGKGTSSTGGTTKTTTTKTTKKPVVKLKPTSSGTTGIRRVVKPRTTGSFSKYYDEGLAFYEQGDYSRAVTSYTQALRIKQDGDAYFNRGLAYYGLEDYRNAIADYTQSIRLVPQSDAYFNRALAYDYSGDDYNAMNDYTSAIRLDPQYAKAYYNRGLLHYNAESYDKAIADYSMAIRYNAQNANYFYNRALAYDQTDQYDLALADYTKSIQLDPQPDAYNNRGLVWENKGNKTQAMNDYRRALQLKPDYELARKNLTRLQTGSSNDDYDSDGTDGTTTTSNKKASAAFNKMWIDYDVTEKGQKGMRIHVNFNVNGMKGVDGYLAIYFQKKGGDKLFTSNTAYRSKAGQVAIYYSIKPGYDPAYYEDATVFIPYAEFNLPRGKYDLQMDVDVIYQNGDLLQHLELYDFVYTKG
jgi:Flp pilus assembly protein TadD